MSKKLPTIWPATPHTKAKITILKNYLNAWFRILGSSPRNKEILYVDGFAGPGTYTNYEEGSPLAAVAAAVGAINHLNGSFNGRLHCAFIEKDSKRYEKLTESLVPYLGKEKLGITHYECEFVEGIERIRAALPGPFRGEGPLFVFADPFGGTQIPFSTFLKCMEGASGELLINLDADGIARIFQADNARREEQLTELFGGEDWREVLSVSDPQAQLSLKILHLYKRRLRTIALVKYVWSFAMRGVNDNINYHLVFASKHPLGLEKMKEAMRAIDQTGTYSFSDAHVDQHALFREDNESFYADKMWALFEGKKLGYDEILIYALNETPFLNAKSMLRYLESRGMVEPALRLGVSRKKGDFSEEKILAVQFGRFGQSELF